MNRSTPPLASPGSEDCNISDDLKQSNCRYQKLVVMNYPLLSTNVDDMQQQSRISAGDARINGSTSPEHDEGHQRFSTGTGNATPKTFPETLKEILSDADNQDAISWLPHGKAFLVLDRKLFVQKVLPRYLGKATKYTSFTRKLSRWNFVRVGSGPDEGAWFNKSFFREYDVHKLKEMKCAKRKKSNPSKEFPRSKPLKKRPVDASLFAKVPSPDEIAQRGIIGGRPAYTYGGRPLALADTRSVVQAAMRALLQSHPVVAPDVSSLVRHSNALFTSGTMSANVLSPMHATQKGSDSL